MNYAFTHLPFHFCVSLPFSFCLGGAELCSLTVHTAMPHVLQYAYESVAVESPKGLLGWYCCLEMSILQAWELHFRCVERRYLYQNPELRQSAN